MGKKLFVGNLPFSANDQSLFDAFSQCGTVESASVIVDRASGRSKGFGFVEMGSDAEAATAISKFHGADFDGRPMTVNEAKPMEPRGDRGGDRRPPRNNDRGGRGGYGGGGGGGRGRY